jgi:hypothetical protein
VRHREEQRRSEQCQNARSQGLDRKRRAREEERHDQDAEGGPLRRSCGGGFDEAVLHQRLHDQPGDRQRSTRQHRRHGPRQAADEKQLKSLGIGEQAPEREFSRTDADA